MSYVLQSLNRPLPLLLCCLLGCIVTMTSAAELHLSEQGTPRFSSHSIDEVIDLREVFRENGFGDRLDSSLAIQRFARYGSNDRLLRYQKADQFDRGDIQKEMDAHQEKIAKQAFVLRGLPMATLDLGDFDEAKGLALCARLGFRLFRATPANGGVRSKLLASVRPCRANAGDYWFLTKDHKMAQCRNKAEVKEIQKNDGFLYHPDALTTDLVLILAAEREVDKQIGRNPGDYSLDVVIDGFRFEKPLEWGYYLRSALLEERGDCDALASWNNMGAFGIVPNPHYFRVDAAKQEPCVSAFLVAANLRDK